MDRQGIIAVALAIAVLVFWQIDNSKRTATQLAEKQKAAELARLNAPPEPEPAAPVTAPGSLAVPAAAGEPRATEQTDPVDTPSVKFDFTNLGGGIQRAVLKKHQAEHDANVVMNQFGGHPIGSLSETPGGETRVPYTREDGTSPSEVTFVRTEPNHLEIRKKFTVPQAGATRDEYLTVLEVTFTNVGQQPLQFPGYYVYTGSVAPIHQIDQAQYIGYAWMPGGKFSFKSTAAFKSGGTLGMGKEDAPIFQEEHAETTWAAVTNQYFSSIVVPLDAKAGGGWARRFDINKTLIGSVGEAHQAGDFAVKNVAADDPQNTHGVEGALGLPGFTLQPGEKQVRKFEIYTGPREYERLKSLGHGEDEIMEFGTFKFVSKVLLNTMNWLHSKFNSYAAAIVVLTIIIRGLMWPLQNKATQSMKKMQALTPLMNDLKAKYKDDPGRMNQELMKLYKDYQINPLAGCLPMVVQIPIFFGFFNMLGKAVELRHARFLWVKDLSQMDTIATVAGQPINVLPLCMAVTMLWQMSLSPKSGDAVQQRVFMFMPLIFIFFCYKYASALALYWTVQNLFSVAQLYITRNQTAPVLQKVSAPSKKR